MPYVAGALDTTVIDHPSMSFRAVIAGWLVATGIAALLYVGGVALGFSAFDAWHAESSAKAIGIGTAIWMILTWATSLLLGGLFASWFDAHDDQTTGALHGITVWGLSVTTTGLWLALGLANAMHGMSNGANEMHGQRGSSPGETSTLSGNGSVAVLHADVAARLPTHDRGASDEIVAALIASKEDVASQLMAANTSTTSAAAMETFHDLSAQINAAREDAKSTADRAAHYTAMVLWIALISAFVALIAAALGGWLGAGHIHRVYHLRSYPGRIHGV